MFFHMMYANNRVCVCVMGIRYLSLLVNTYYYLVYYHLLLYFTENSTVHIESML